MKSIKARVINGRLVVDEPSLFPDGTELDLTVADGGDDLTPEERAALHEALHGSWRSAQAGDLRPAKSLLDKLSASE